MSEGYKMAEAFREIARIVNRDVSNPESVVKAVKRMSRVGGNVDHLVSQVKRQLDEIADRVNQRGEFRNHPPTIEEIHALNLEFEPLDDAAEQEANHAED